jgi:capsule polysaccharide export protein KpsC/LpsZ
MVQKKLQLQVLQKEVAQLHYMMKQQQQSVTIIDTLDKYASHIQDFIQRYIQASATLIIKAELGKAMMEFTAAELKTVEKVWKTLQPFAQMSIWMQHPDKTEEEMEIREIEESLLA